MFDICEQQFLMLLFVLQSECYELCQVIVITACLPLQQGQHALVNLMAIVDNPVKRRAAD